MTDEQQSAIDNLRSGNLELSNLVKDAVNKAVKKSAEMMDELEDPTELLTNVKVLSEASKIVGLSPKESQVNMQINAINGFDFIELDEEDIRQISCEEEFEEAEVEQNNSK